MLHFSNITVLGLSNGEYYQRVRCRIERNFFQAGEWHHVVYTWDGSVRAIYIDGEIPNASCLETGIDANAINVSASSLNIAGLYSSSTWDLNGKMDNVRIYSEGLSISEIQKIYAQEKVEFGGK